MTLKEFDEMMQRGQYDYSIAICLDLEAAAYETKEAKKDCMPAMQLADAGEAYDWQLMALRQAEWESEHGKLIEPRIKYIATTDLMDMWRTYTKWENYLAKIGRRIERIDLNEC